MMRIHDALREEGFVFEYDYADGEDRTEIWVNEKQSMSVRIQWLKIEGDDGRTIASDHTDPLS